MEMITEMLDRNMNGVDQPYTYRQWIHDACRVVYRDENYYTDEQLDKMSDKELIDLCDWLMIAPEGSSREWDGTH